VPRPQLTIFDIVEADPDLKQKVEEITGDSAPLQQIEIQTKYSGYIEKEYEMVEELKKQENMVIPEQIHYETIQSLSTEGRQKLEKIKPETIGQASRISGVSSSDIAVLMVYLKN
jgi:tRNA uridine 5-carboxymethylaminomethyl modification enzyme